MSLLQAYSDGPRTAARDHQADDSSRWMPGCPDREASVRDGIAGVLIAAPPTGARCSSRRGCGISWGLPEAGLWFISDEIYHGLTYGMPAETALQHSDDVLVINSFSKYFSMTGWRVGWMVVPEQLVRTVEKLAQNLYIAPPTVSQVAALGAFDGLAELEANKRVYAANRELLLTELPKAGFDRIVPADGAFYLYVDVSRFTDDSLAFAKLMLDETACSTPGSTSTDSRALSVFSCAPLPTWPTRTAAKMERLK